MQNQNEMDNNVSPIADFNFEQTPLEDIPQSIRDEGWLNELLCKHESRLNQYEWDLELVEKNLKDNLINKGELFLICVLSGGVGSLITYLTQS